MTTDFATRADETPPLESKDARTEARARFERAIALFENGSWDAALAEFLESRKLFPTRVATNDAALCLRRLGRNDEALAMFETLLREFPDLPAAERALVENQILQLKATLATVVIQSDDVGASLTIDDRARGTLPLASPLRVPAGSHVVRIYKDGFLPFESRIDVAGGAAATVPVRLVALTRVGRLRIAERDGRELDVVVDGSIVGKTPWEGAVAPGKHVVVLKSDGELGTEPTRAEVLLSSITPLTLSAEPLRASLRISAEPANANLAIDGIDIGNGPWEGRLRASPHRITATLDNYVTAATEVSLRDGGRETVALRLEPDLASPVWARALPSRLFLDASIGGAIVALDGGIAENGGVPAGVLVMARLGYELGSGVGLRGGLGYLGFGSDVAGRTATVRHPENPHDERVTHSIGARAFVVGAGVAYHRGTKLRWTAGLDAGVALGSVADDRTGSFRSVVVAPNTPYDVSARQANRASWLYVGPELRLGIPVGRSIELAVGVSAHLLKALAEPEWDPKRGFPAGPDGAGYFDAESTLGSTLLVISPNASIRYDL